MSTRVCAVPACGRRHHGRGLCTRHYTRAYRVLNLERERLRDAERYQKNPKRQLQVRRNVEKFLSSEHGSVLRKKAIQRYNQRRARAVKRATPTWADTTKIKEFYKACPPGMQVDHIVPILGKNVCGLHVPANLQYLDPRANSKKGNRHNTP